MADDSVKKANAAEAEEDSKARHARLWARMWADYKAEGLEPAYLWDEEPEGRDPDFRARLLTLPVHKGENRGMFIVCAGGAFILKAYHEARPVAEYFHKKGFNAAVLDYTVAWKEDEGPIAAGGRAAAQAAALQDAQRAIRTLRHNADALGFPKDKIAIGGFSAGGMLSGMAATLFDAGDPASADPIERESSRPDAALILYGAMSFSTLIQDMSYDAAKQNASTRFDNLLNLNAKCPPFFIFQTHKDDPRFAMTFGKALADYGIPFEVHTFANGGHGGGLYDGGVEDAPLQPHTARWAELAAEWLEDMKF